MSIDFSSQQFSVNSSTVPYNIALTCQKKEIACAQNQKNSADDDGWNRYRRWWAANGIDERGEQIDAFPTIWPHSREDEGHDSVGLILMRQVLRKMKIQKVGTQERRKPVFITVKYVNDYEKGPTMTWRIERWRRLLAISDMSLHTWRQCSDNDVSSVAVPTLLHEKKFQKVTTRWSHD